MILLFDGVCNLCNGAVQWVILRDQHRRFRYAALQSETGQNLLAQHGLSTTQFDSLVLVTPDRVYTHSEAAIRLAMGLGWPWRAVAVFLILPRFLRDGVYNWIARNRYRFFGKREQCMLPKKEWKELFL